MKLFGRRSSQQTATGIHITSNGAVAAVSVDRSRGRLPRIVQARCQEPDSGTNMERALRAVVEDNRSPTTLVMNDEHYELLLVEAPRVEPAELKAAVRWKIRNLIDFHVDDAVIDVFEIPGQGNRPQGQAMMYAVAARARVVREHIEMFEEADLNLQVIDIIEMSLRNLAAQLEDDVRGAAMLYLDENHGVMTITQQGSLYLSRRIETGSETLAEMQNAGFEQVALEVQRSLDYYDSHFGQPPIASLSVLPGFAAHAGLIETLNDSLSIRVGDYPASEVVNIDVEMPDIHPAAVLLALGGALRQEKVSL